MGLPLGGGTRSGFFEHTINLFKGETFSLRHEEVSVDESTCAECTPDEEDAGLEISLISSNHVWSDDGDDSIPEPVRSSGKSDTPRSDRKREDFSDKDPSAGTPSGSKEENEDGDERDLGVHGGNVVSNARCTVSREMGLVEPDCDTNDGYNELADKHA